MAGLDPRIKSEDMPGHPWQLSTHPVFCWMAGSSPAMTRGDAAGNAKSNFLNAGMVNGTRAKFLPAAFYANFRDFTPISALQESR
jgi:hypothetical protein